VLEAVSEDEAVLELVSEDDAVLDIVSEDDAVLDIVCIQRPVNESENSAQRQQHDIPGETSCPAAQRPTSVSDAVELAVPVTDEVPLLVDVGEAVWDCAQNDESSG
jgi:hypothetical protein